MKTVATEEGFDPKAHTVLELDLASVASVRKFVAQLGAIKGKPLDRLVCNAAVYQPAESEVRHMSHWVLSHVSINISLLLS
jgi:protochlorophyllide reductase